MGALACVWAGGWERGAAGVGSSEGGEQAPGATQVWLGALSRAERPDDQLAAADEHTQDNARELTRNLLPLSSHAPIACSRHTQHSGSTGQLGRRGAAGEPRSLQHKWPKEASRGQAAPAPCKPGPRLLPARRLVSSAARCAPHVYIKALILGSTTCREGEEGARGRVEPQRGGSRQDDQRAGHSAHQRGQDQRPAARPSQGAGPLPALPSRLCCAPRQPPHLRAPDVRHTEHKLEDSVPAGNDGGVGDEDGAGALLGVGDAAAKEEPRACGADARVTVGCTHGSAAALLGMQAQAQRGLDLLAAGPRGGAGRCCMQLVHNVCRVCSGP